MDLSIQKDMKTIRNILHLKQGELADDMGISRAHLVGLEKGKVKLTKSYAILFVVVISMHIDNYPEDSIEYKLLRVYDDKFVKVLSEIVERG